MNTRIKSVRRSARLTQEAFAQSLGTSRNAIHSYESGRVVPNGTFIKLLCLLYHVSESWLTTGQGNMHSEVMADFVKTVVTERSGGYYALKVLECYFNLDEQHKEAVRDYIRALSQLFERPDSVSDINVISAVEKTLIEMALNRFE